MLDVSTLASDFLSLASECNTNNKLNKLLIGLENLLAPLEFSYFVDLARIQQLPSPSYAWLLRIAGFSPGIFDSPQHFGRRALTENVLLYENQSVSAAEKTLLVAFSGNGRRLGMPISVFLQCLDSNACDVVLLRKGGQKDRSYLAGLEGLSNHFPGVIRRVQTATSAWQYRNVITLGVSSGGYAAILAAVLMNAARGVSFGGCPPKSALSFGLRWRLAMRQALATPGPEFDFVYGDNHDHDHHAASSLLSSFGGRLRPVAGVGDHNVLGALLKRGHLNEFLDGMRLLA